MARALPRIAGIPAWDCSLTGKCCACTSNFTFICLDVAKSLRFFHSWQVPGRLLICSFLDTCTHYDAALHLQAVYFYFYSLLRKFFVARLQRLTQTKSQVSTAVPCKMHTNMTCLVSEKVVLKLVQADLRCTSAWRLDGVAAVRCMVVCC